MTLLDYFLSDYLKTQFYRRKPQSTPELKDGIIHLISAIENVNKML